MTHAVLATSSSSKSLEKKNIIFTGTTYSSLYQIGHHRRPLEGLFRSQNANFC